MPVGVPRLVTPDPFKDALKLAVDTVVAQGRGDKRTNAAFLLTGDRSHRHMRVQKSPFCSVTLKADEGLNSRTAWWRQ